LTAAPNTVIPWSDTNARSLPTGAQAIVTNYTFQCCGHITRWQAWVQPGGSKHNNGVYSIDFQVWRPLPNIQDSYSLAGVNSFHEITLQNGGLVYQTVTSVMNGIEVKPGDVVGYRATTKDNSGNEGIQLQTEPSFRGNQVWYNRNLPASDSPVSVGTGGTLNEMMEAAPVLRVTFRKQYFILCVSP